MSVFYSVAYAVGFTPWERAAEADPTVLPRLIAREEADHGGPGKALDLGCGSGAHTVTLAERGWKVTGVDLVPKALERARRRIAQHGVDADVVRGDVSELSPETVGSGFDFFLDVGCFHGLTDPQRHAMGRAVTAVAAPDATMMLFAFSRALPRPMPRGVDHSGLMAAFGDWVLLDVAPAATEAIPKPLRKAAPHWYRLGRER